MDYKDQKARRIEFVPPLPLKQDIETYCDGNKSKFIIDACKAHIKRIKDANREVNKVSRCL